MEIGGKVAALRCHCHDACCTGKEDVQEYTGAHVVDAAGGVQRDDALASGCIALNQGCDTAKNRRGGTHVCLGKPCQQESEALSLFRSSLAEEEGSNEQRAEGADSRRAAGVSFRAAKGEAAER